MPPWSAIEIEVDGVKLFCHRTGGAKPPIILAHGFSDDGLCWTRVARELEDSYDVLMPDARGHGRSERIQIDAPLDMAIDLAGLIQTLGLERTVVLGHSMGAVTAATVAARQPSLVSALILEDPPWLDSDPDEEREAETTGNEAAPNPFEQWVRELQTKSLPEVVLAGRARNPSWVESELEPWARSKLQLDLSIFKIDPVFPDWREIVPKIVCPTLVITGDVELGGRITPGVAQQLVQLCPTCQIAHIPDAGHNIHRERFSIFMDVLWRFLEAEPGV